MPVLEIDYGNGADGDAVVGADATIGSRNYRSFTQNGGALTVLSGSVVRAQSAIRLLGGYVWVQQVGGGYSPGAGGAAATGANSGGGGGGGGGHNGAGTAGGGGAGPFPGGGGGNGGVYDSVSDQILNDPPDAYFAGSQGGAGGGGTGGALDLGDGAHGAGVAGPGWDFVNGLWRFTTLTINDGAIFRGVSTILVQGDLHIAGTFQGTGYGSPGGAGAPAGSNYNVTGSRGGYGGGGYGGASYHDTNGAACGGGGGGLAGPGGGGGWGGGQGWGTTGPGGGGPTENYVSNPTLYAGNGGGGGGGEKSGSYQYRGGNGGNGGASVTLRANRIIGGGAVVADGNPGEAAPGAAPNSSPGAGGAGSGGMLRVEANISQCSVRLYARGGAGGRNDIPVGYGASSGGPGGGGGGGFVYVRYGNNLGLPTADVSGGAGAPVYTGSGVNQGSNSSGGTAGQFATENFGLPGVGAGAGGLAGGCVKFVAPTVEIAIPIYAVAGAGAAGASNGAGGGGGGGGGSAGAVWVIATIIRGAGPIYVYGAGGGAGGTNAGAGGNGAPGRIRFDCANNEYTGATSVGVDRRQLRVRGAPVLIG